VSKQARLEGRQTPSPSPSRRAVLGDLKFNFERTPAKTSAEVHELINDFLNIHRPQMEALVRNADTVSKLIPSWKTDASCDPKLADHISKLQIPTVPDGRPSLLLHDLGVTRNHLDKQRAALIPRIFSFASHTYVAYCLNTFSMPMPSPL
jgi:hypothetical protein